MSGWAYLLPRIQPLLATFGEWWRSYQGAVAASPAGKVLDPTAHQWPLSSSRATTSPSPLGLFPYTSINLRAGHVLCIYTHPQEDEEDRNSALSSKCKQKNPSVLSSTAGRAGCKWHSTLCCNWPLCSSPVRSPTGNLGCWRRTGHTWRRSASAFDAIDCRRSSRHLSTWHAMCMDWQRLSACSSRAKASGASIYARKRTTFCSKGGRRKVSTYIKYMSTWSTFKSRRVFSRIGLTCSGWWYGLFSFEDTKMSSLVIQPSLMQSSIASPLHICMAA